MRFSQQWLWLQGYITVQSCGSQLNFRGKHCLHLQHQRVSQAIYQHQKGSKQTKPHVKKHRIYVATLLLFLIGSLCFLGDPMGADVLLCKFPPSLYRSSTFPHAICSAFCHLLAGFLIGLSYNPEDGGNMSLCNTDWLSPHYMVLYPRTQNSTYKPILIY
jgi:hypothetical protein